MKILRTFTRAYYLKHLLICFLVELMLLYGAPLALLANPNPPAGALPSGHTTPYGGVGSFDYSTGRLDIQNVANGAVINWQKFDIGAGATTEFHQVNSSAYVLNRVNAVDGMATGIKGNLTANGGIIVVNPHGIVIGPDALINAAKFVASGLGISNGDFRDFANGDIEVLRFDAGCFAGNVTNNGTITADQAAYLVGEKVTNTGTISCPGGMVVMAAGEKVFLAEVGSNVVVDKLDTSWNPGDNVVTNTGTIDAEGGKVLLAAGDIFSQAAIEGAQSFVALANRNVNINGALDIQGDITLYADYDQTLPGDFHSTAPISAGGNIKVRANDVLFEDTVYAGGNLTIKGRDCYQPDEWPWGNVHATRPLDADGDITISVTGETEKARWVGDGVCWGGHWEYYTEYEPGTIWLDGDVTAGGNLSIYNNTYTGAGVTLRAGNNILLANGNHETTPPQFCEWLTGNQWLALRAGNEIQAPQTVISVTGSALIMEQGLSINLDSYLFANQANTDLTLISNGGSVTAVETGTRPENAADQWVSVGATAANADGGENAIHLSGNQNDITTTELRAYNDNILVNAKAGKVLATENVTADTGSITLIGNTGIDVSRNLTASDGITLDGVVTAVGASTQDFEAGSGTLWAKNTITKTGAGDLYLGGDAGINLDGTVEVDAGSLIIEDDFSAAGDLLASDDVTLNGAGQLDGAVDQRIDAENGTLSASGTLTKTAAGNLNLGGQAGINLDGTVDVEAGSLIIEDDFVAAGDLLASDDVTLNGAGQLDGAINQRIDAENGTLSASGTLTKTGAGNLNLGGQAGINLDGTVDVDAGSLIIEDDFSAAGDLLASDNVTLDGDATLDGVADQSVIAENGTVLAGGTVTKSTTGQMNILAADGITLSDAAAAVDSMYLNADTDGDGFGDMWAGGTLTTTNGNIEIYSSDSTTYLYDDVTAGRDVILHNNTWAADGVKLDAAQDVTVGEGTADGTTLTGEGALTVEADRHITLGGAVVASADVDGDLVLWADKDGDTDGDMTAYGAIYNAGGSINIYSSDGTTYLGGDVYAGHDITLNNNTKVNGYGDQRIEAGNELTADGYVRKCTQGDMYLLGGSEDLSIDLRYDGDDAGTSTYSGNLWILGAGDIQISGDVTTFGESCIGCEERTLYTAQLAERGGVAIISDGGSIYTEDADGALNVSVTGSSDHWAGTGVYGFGLYTDGGEPTVLSTDGGEAKAAIAIVSADPLKIGEDGRLEAAGRYYSDGSVDDRAGIGFLDVPAEIPAGRPRDPGVAFDLAIYTASKNGSVEIDCPVTITSETGGLTAEVEQGQAATGAMVIDAYDLVVLGDQFKNSLKNGMVGDRLEVASRITEWLDDAVGRLPFPDDLDLPDGYHYVMRGAGLEKDQITDGRAWVLEAVAREAAPIQQQELKFTGCPALMNWVAKELDIEQDQLQMYMEGTLAMAGNIQPCDMCARLQGAALALLDADGTQVAALARVINQFAATPGPVSEEQMALIAAAMQNPAEGSDYALAAQWLDALTEYVSILNGEMKMSMDESAAFAAKYAEPIISGDNAAVAAYVQTRLAGFGG